jgi:hypothetical protein
MLIDRRAHPHTPPQYREFTHWQEPDTLLRMSPAWKKEMVLDKCRNARMLCYFCIYRCRNKGSKVQKG